MGLVCARTYRRYSTLEILVCIVLGFGAGTVKRGKTTLQKSGDDFKNSIATSLVSLAPECMGPR